MSQRMYDEGEILELTISDQGEGTHNFARTEDGCAVFVEGKTVPGDQVRVTVTQMQANLLRADLLEVVTPAPERIEALCPHFETCGGCKWQNLPYESELALKQKRVTDALERIGHQREVEILDIIGAPLTEAYRNKLTFTRDAAGNVGYHLPHNPDEVMPISRCMLGDDTMNELLEACRDLPFKKLVLRKSEHSGRYQVIRGGELTAVNGQPTTIKRQLEEKLLNFTYRLSPEAFFQVNTVQAERLVREALRLSDPQPTHKILELFCGLGTFSLPFASRSKKLIGFEGTGQAVKDAETNARQNHLSNCNFYTANLNKADHLAFKRRMGFTPDLVLTDPPRAGMAGTLCDTLLKIAAPTILYVSCNPATLARDVDRLSKTYALTTVQPIDLFPRTEHVECIALLKRTS